MKKAPGWHSDSGTDTAKCLPGMEFLAMLLFAVRGSGSRCRQTGWEPGAAYASGLFSFSGSEIASWCLFTTLRPRFVGLVAGWGRASRLHVLWPAAGASIQHKGMFVRISFDWLVKLGKY